MVYYASRRTVYRRRPMRRVARRTKPVRTRRQRKLQPAGLSYKRKVMLRYCTQQVLTGTSGAKGQYVFRCGSIFDPDYTGGGHQPLGHDEWATFYNNYSVVQSFISVQPVNSGAVPCAVSILKTDDPLGSGGNLADDIEQGKCTWRVLAEDNAQHAVTVKHSFNQRREFPRLYKDDALNPSFGSNPSEDKYWIVAVQATDGSSTVSVPLIITINYICWLSVPKVLVQS